MIAPSADVATLWAGAQGMLIPPDKLVSKWESSHSSDHLPGAKEGCGQGVKPHREQAGPPGPPGR